MSEHKAADQAWPTEDAPASGGQVPVEVGSPSGIPSVPDPVADVGSGVDDVDAEDAAAPDPEPALDLGPASDPEAASSPASATPSGPEPGAIPVPEPLPDQGPASDPEAASSPASATPSRPEPVTAVEPVTTEAATSVSGAAPGEGATAAIAVPQEADVTAMARSSARVAARPAPRPAVPWERPPDLRLATLHLRVGMLGLARAELEAAAGAEDLDEAGLLDLAEVRWRSGDLRGAASAATAWLDGCPPSSRAASQDALAHVVLAESAATRGRDDDVASHAAAALDALAAVAGSPTAESRGRRDVGRTSVESLLAGVFAGIQPYAAVWAGPASAAPSPARPPQPRSAPAAPPTMTAEPAEAVAMPGEAGRTQAAVPAAPDQDQATLWEPELRPEPVPWREPEQEPDSGPEAVARTSAAPAPPPAGSRLDAAASLEQATTTLAADPDRAAILFLLALRSGADPSVVLDAIGDDDGQPALALVRAEALASTGHHAAAAEVLASAGLASAGAPDSAPGADDDRSAEPG